MEEVSNALAVAALALLATQAVVATLGFTFVGRIRDLVRGQQDAIKRQHLKELREVQDDIRRRSDDFHSDYLKG